DVARISLVKLLLGLQFVHGLLVRALGFLELTVSLYNVGSSYRHFRFDFLDLAARSLYRSLLLRAVQPEDRRPLCNRAAITDKNLGNAPVCFGKDRDSSEEKRDVGRGWVVVKNYCDQAYGKDQAAGDAPPEFEPDRVEGYFLADPFSLDIPSVKIVRQNC